MRNSWRELSDNTVDYFWLVRFASNHSDGRTKIELFPLLSVPFARISHVLLAGWTEYDS